MYKTIWRTEASPEPIKLGLAERLVEELPLLRVGEVRLDKVFRRCAPPIHVQARLEVAAGAAMTRAPARIAHAPPPGELDRRPHVLAERGGAKGRADKRKD